MKKTALYEAHTALDAKTGPFAGYDMPLYYAEGVLKEHEWVRSQAGLFDVSHMGQVLLEGPGATAFWEHVTPSSFGRMKNGSSKYTVLANAQGGILDDLIVTKITDEKYYAVINAGRKDADVEWLRAHVPAGVTMMYEENKALLALQGPAAEKTMFAVFGVDLSGMDYMTGQAADLDGVPAFICRLGYTGEDGFEISVPAHEAPRLWDMLLAHEDVKPIGLAARDSLRLEMGYCLYGHDIDETTTPVEAAIGWVMRKDGLESCIGGERLAAQRDGGVLRRRVGVRLLDKGVAREGAALFDERGEPVGALTSGGFSPTLKQSIGQGYVVKTFAQPGQKIMVDVRGRHIPAEICAMPFLPPRTKAAKK